MGVASRGSEAHASGLGWQQGEMEEVGRIFMSKVRALPSCMKGNFEPRAELLAPIATTKAEVRALNIVSEAQSADTEANRQVLQEEVAEAAKASEAKGKAPKAEQLSEAGVTEAPEEAVADIAKGHVPTVEPAEVGEHGSEADHQAYAFCKCRCGLWAAGVITGLVNNCA
eukprot:1228958-Amphidinium_carterae.1